MKAVRKSHVGQENFDHEFVGIHKQMYEADYRLVDEHDALSDCVSQLYESASQYKKLHIEYQDKLFRSVECVRELQVELRREKVNVDYRSSERARLRSVLLDSGSVLSGLRFELSNLTAERKSAVHDHRTLRDSMASMVTGVPVPI